MRFEPPPIPAEEQERLADLCALDILDTEPERAFDNLTRLASILTGAPIALISLVDTDRQWFKSRFGLDVTETSRDISFCGHAILTDSILVVPDALEDDRFAENPLVLGPPYIRFYAGVPLSGDLGLRIGTLCVIDTEPREGLTATEEEGLRALATTVVDELELRRAMRTVHDRQEEIGRYYALMGSTNDFMAYGTPEGGVVGINPAGRRMTGYRPDEDLAGLTLTDFHPPETVDMVWATAIPTARRTGYWRGEAELLTEGGDVIPVDQVVLCHRDETGAITGMSTICRDISERDEIIRLREVQLMKDAFVSTVSHELRTPLTSIAMSLAMFTDGFMGDLDDEAMKVLRIARANSERLTHLVDDILDLERSEHGRPMLTFSSAAIPELVKPALQTLEGHAAAAGITIELQIETNPALVIVCDPGRIVRVLVNLLTNAIKFSGIGAVVVLRVEHAPDDMVTFSVIDNGIGIREEAIPHLFDPFWQADSSSSRAVQGSGLGLAISKQIIDAHRGFFEVSSVFRKGSTFSFSIPIT